MNELEKQLVFGTKENTKQVIHAIRTHATNEQLQQSIMSSRSSETTGV